MPNIELDNLAKQKSIRWRVSKLTEIEDICQLLADEKISVQKAIEAIYSRISGNEPALPNRSE